DAPCRAAQRGRKGLIHKVPEPPLDIGVVHGGGRHFEQDLVGLRGWQGDIFVAHHFWAAECMDSRRFHVDSSFPSPSLYSLLISRRGRSSAWPRLPSMARGYHNHVCDEGLESSSRNIPPTRARTLHTRKELYSEDEPGAGGKPY